LKMTCDGALDFAVYPEAVDPRLTLGILLQPGALEGRE